MPTPEISASASDAHAGCRREIPTSKRTLIIKYLDLAAWIQNGLDLIRMPPTFCSHKIRCCSGFLSSTRQAVNLNSLMQLSDKKPARARRRSGFEQRNKIFLKRRKGFLSFFSRNTTEEYRIGKENCA
jgi:hypothetical protein